MEVEKILRDLYARRAAIDEAIVALERLAAKHAPNKRGRPPKWLKAAREKAEESKR